YPDANVPPVTAGLMTFLDIAWPNEAPRRLYMKTLDNTARARQHLTMMTGQRQGASYKGLNFMGVVNKCEPGEDLVIARYGGARAAPLLRDVTVNDIVIHEGKAGLVGDVSWTDGDHHDDDPINNALYESVLRERTSTGFARVTSGLEILQDVAKSDQRSQIKIVDCGVILNWR
ncbi:unnamed protein product, partial [Meganyctiphanes norvegica]